MSKEWAIIVSDLKDGFFTIPLHEHDKERFAFTATTHNNAQSIKRYQWNILPQGMLNSLNLCQYFVQQPLQIIHRIVPQLITCHYMDDILLANSDRATLEKMMKQKNFVLMEFADCF